jgi:gluconokinase
MPAVPGELRRTLVLVIMGVSGSGKTTIGKDLAAAVGWPFRDADEFHPPANIAKMSARLPLDDRDRAPWLAAIHAYIEECVTNECSAVVTCSALKKEYRARIVTDPAVVKLVYLAGDFALIQKRMSERPGHFMKPEMLKSQFAALEPPEHALKVDIAQSPDAIVRTIRQAFNL